MADAGQVVEWLDQINSRGVNLSTWETEFVEKMANKVEMYGDRVRFSEAEASKVEQIYTERVP